MVHAEGGWLSPGFGFEAGFTVVFEQATAVYSTQNAATLSLHGAEAVEAIDVPGDGYLNEVADFVNAVEAGRPSAVVTAEDAVASLKLVEAEARSVAAGGQAESLGR